MFMCCRATFFVFFAICSCIASSSGLPSSSISLDSVQVWSQELESAPRRQLASESGLSQSHDSLPDIQGRRPRQHVKPYGLLPSSSRGLKSDGGILSRLLQNVAHISRNKDGVTRKDGAGRRSWPSRSAGMKSARTSSTAGAGKNDAQNAVDGNSQEEGDDNAEVILQVETVEQMQEATNNKDKHWSLLSFELVMLGLLGLALPVVYWRKMRIRHL